MCARVDARDADVPRAIARCSSLSRCGAGAAADKSLPAPQGPDPRPSRKPWCCAVAMHTNSVFARASPPTRRVHIASARVHPTLSLEAAPRHARCDRAAHMGMCGATGARRSASFQPSRCRFRSSGRARRRAGAKRGARRLAPTAEEMLSAPLSGIRFGGVDSPRQEGGWRQAHAGQGVRAECRTERWGGTDADDDSSAALARFPTRARKVLH